VRVHNANPHRKSRFDTQPLAPFVGQGLLTSEGDLWKRQRRLLQPLFSQQMFETYAQVVTDYTAEMLDRWKPWVESGQTFDLAEELTALTMRVIARTILGLDFAGASKEVLEALEVGMDHANSMLETVLPLPD